MTGATDWHALHRRLQEAEARLAAAEAHDAGALERLLRERARRLAARTPPRREETRSALVVRVGEERFGLEPGALAGVAPFEGASAVPGGPPELAGVVATRGEIWAVHDLGRLTGTGEAGSGGHVVLLRHPRRRVGLRVDAAERVETWTPAALRRVGADRDGRAAHLVAGVLPGPVLLIDLAALWGHRAIAEAR
jgi:chemotaxis signal transduction protein